MNEINLKPILSPLFLLGLFLLLLNDFVLKGQYANVLTGKLSDFSGLFILPLFLVTLLPKNRLLIYIATGLFFVFWKSPMSEGLIQSVNSFEVFRIGRTVDYSDLCALLVLPASYFYSKHQTEVTIHYSINSLRRISHLVVITISVFAFTATSFEEERNVSVSQSYEVRFTKNEFDQKLKGLRKVTDVEIEKQTDVWPANQYPDVKTKPNSFYVRFALAEKYCDSNELRIILTFDEEETIKVDYVSFNYWCKEKPTDLDNQQLISIFQREVIENLK